MKKVLSIIALCLIAILAGTIIVFSCVDKSYNLNLTNPDYLQVSVKDQVNKESYYKDGDNDHKAIYDKVLNLYNESYKQKIMSSVFSGTAFDRATITRSGVSVSSFLSSGTYLIFNYENEQTLKIDGKTYTYTYSSGSKETNIKYKTLYIEVKNTKTVSSFNIYIKSLSSDYSYYRYTVLAKQADLYNYIQENFVD